MPLPRTGKVVYIASLFTWAAVLRGSERSICPPPPSRKSETPVLRFVSGIAV